MLLSELWMFFYFFFLKMCYFIKYLIGLGVIMVGKIKVL